MGNATLWNCQSVGDPKSIQASGGYILLELNELNTALNVDRPELEVFTVENFDF